MELHWGDAMRMPLGELRPEVTAFVANLPYHVAAPLVLDSIDGLPRLRALVRAHPARGRRPPGGHAGQPPAYGGPSVLRALALEPAGRHLVSRRVFVPQPNVDSTLVAFRRRPDWPELAPDWTRIKRTVAASFSHRRKTLPNALTLAGWASRPETEAAIRAASIDPRLRAEALEPADFVRLARVGP